jgi:ribose-phosphate pyrophosphokinase
VTKAAIVALPENEGLAFGLAARLGLDFVASTVRSFPDGETLARIDGPCADRDTVIVASLHHPDPKLLPVAFLADALRGAGARRVLLVAPYLPYMRQDRRFHPGEALTSRAFARILSSVVDGIVTIDPHLHRYASLGELYAIPTEVLHAAVAVAAWLRTHVERPILVGPDEESRQWVAEVAGLAGAPCVVLEKVRSGDRDVRVSVPDVDRWRDHTPVLVDDIIATGRTMAETIGHLVRAGLCKPVCVGVHAVFAEGALEGLEAAGAATVVTSDTIPHATNAIAIDALLAEGLRRLLGA